MNRGTGVVGVRKVGRQSQQTAATLVDDLDGQSGPAWLSVFDDVEQERAVGQLAGVGVIATVVNSDFNALLTQRALLTHVVVREVHLEFFAVGVPCHEIRAVGGDDQVGEWGFGVHHVPDHAHLCAEVAHHGGNGVGDHHRSPVGKFKHVRHRGPVAGLAAAVNGAGADVVITGGHGHARRDDVFATFLSRVAVQNVLTAAHDAGVPCVLTCGGDFHVKGHRVDGVDVVVGIALGKHGDEITTLNDVGAAHLRGFLERNAVVVNANFLDVVAGGHVAADAHEACAEVGGPHVAWKRRGVKRGRSGQIRRARSHVEIRDGDRVNGRGRGTVLVEEFKRTTAGVVQVARVLDVRLDADRVASDVRGAASVVGDLQS